jgi:hypothetical protein
VPRKTHLAEQLSSSFDCYLQILHKVDNQTQVSLDRDGDWNMRHVCLPCMYKTADEPPLKYSMLVAMDGNNSLKLVDNTFCAGTPHPDDHTSSVPRWIQSEDVDRFKDEVANSQKGVCSVSPRSYFSHYLPHLAQT